MAKKNNVIMDGRDIGTVILPDATVKFFMNASDEAKAKRRYEELLAKGESITLEEVRKTMAERDKNDSTRKIAPAIPAADAIMLDNSESLEKTLETAINIIKEKIQ
jgi:cytidylate kinase